MLSHRNQVPDETLLQKVTQQLSNRGLRSPCKISVTARNGDITLSGTIQYQHQRMAAMQATRCVTGVRRVNDQMQVKVQVKQ